MQLPLQITSRDVQLSPGIKAEIRARVRRLETFYHRIMACRVLVETPHRRHRTGSSYHVRVDLTLPAGELVIKRHPQPELMTAIQRTFNAAQRRLEDYSRVQRGDVKPPARPARGRVVRLLPYDGYGFLATPEGRDIYFHRHSVVNGAFDRLEDGAEVRFTEEPGASGPQASSVAPVRRRRRHASSA